MWKRSWAILSILLCLVAVLSAGMARAQAVRTRILDGMELGKRAGRWRLEIRFSIPVRVLRHSPQSEGDTVRVVVRPLQVSPEDRPAALGRESLRPPPGFPLPLREVEYEGNATGGPFVNVHFDRVVRYRIEPGKDFRSLVLEIPRQVSPLYAIQLGSPPSDPSILGELETPAGLRLYRVTPPGAEELGPRLRLGFFETRAEAEALARRLQPQFPGAWVVGVTPAERSDSARSQVSRPPRAAGPSEPEPPPPSGTGEAASDLASQLMQEGRRAMTAGELDRAVTLFTKILELPENPQSQDAKELLGLARERRGQLAHAKAEYEDYLRRYPDVEGAARVRQRLEALVTARAQPAPSRREEAPPIRRARLDLFGSLFSSYRREARITDVDGTTIVDDSLFNDLHLEARVRGEEYTVRSQASGGYRYEFLEDAEDEIRVSSLFLETTQHEREITGSLGRRSQSAGGVLGRYDGARVSHRFRSVWESALVAGFPVSSSTVTSIDRDTRFVSMSLDRSWFDGDLDSQIYAVHQDAEGRVDRRAVGGELRYSNAGRFLFATVDYDLEFSSLNTLQVVGNWQIDPHSFVNFLVDRRNSPSIALTNALQGQISTSLGELADLVSEEEIRALAEDRTQRSLTLTAGGSRDLNERFQLALDVTATKLTGSPASGGVEATEGTGYELAYFLQLITADLWFSGDTGIFGLRLFDGHDRDSATLTIDQRYPVARWLRLNPKLATEYRRDEQASDELSFRPAFRLEATFREFHIDAETGISWTLRSSAAPEGNEWGYSGSVGVRYDF